MLGEERECNENDRDWLKEKECEAAAHRKKVRCRMSVAGGGANTEDL